MHCIGVHTNKGVIKMVNAMVVEDLRQLVLIGTYAVPAVFVLVGLAYIKIARG